MKKERGALLSIWLWLLVVSFTINVLFLFSERMVSIYHFASPFQRYWSSAVAMVDLAIIFYVFKWKRWAAYVFIAWPLVGLLVTLVRFGNKNPASALILISLETIISIILIRRKWMLLNSFNILHDATPTKDISES